MSERDTEQLKNTAKLLMAATEPLLNSPEVTRPVRRLAKISFKMAKFILDDDLESKEARRHYSYFSVMVDGVAAAISKDWDRPTSVPGAEYFWCLGKCLAKYNECTGNSPDPDDIPDDDFGGAIDPGKAICLNQFALCQIGCMQKWT